MEEAKVNLSLKVGNNILTFRADTVAELEALIKEGEASPTLSGAFFDEKPATPTTAPGTGAGGQHDQGGAGGSTTSTDGVTDTSKAPSEVPTDEEALANVKEVLGAIEEEELASVALVKAAAAKSKQTTEELAGISKAAALALIKGKG